MKVKEIFANPRNWCRAHLWRSTPNGNTQYCLEGALIHCYGNYTAEMVTAKRRVEAVLRAQGVIYSIIGWNDNRYRTPQQVLAVVTEADV